MERNWYREAGLITVVLKRATRVTNHGSDIGIFIATDLIIHVFNSIKKRGTPPVINQNLSLAMRPYSADTSGKE